MFALLFDNPDVPLRIAEKRFLSRTATDEIWEFVRQVARHSNRASYARLGSRDRVDFGDKVLRHLVVRFIEHLTTWMSGNRSRK